MEIVPSTKMVLSGLAYSVQNLSVKMSGEYFNFWLVVFCRGVIGALLAIILWLATPDRCNNNTSILNQHNYIVLLARAICGGATIVAGYMAVIRLTLSQAVFLTSTSPIFTAIMDRIFHGEQWLLLHWMSIIVCIGGIWVSTSGPSLSSNMEGVLCGLASAFFQACVNTTIRMARHENVFLVTIWGMMGSVFMSLPGAVMALTMSSPPHSVPMGQILSLCGTGILSMVAQTLKTSSLATSKTSAVIILRYTEILFSIMWDVLIFHNHLEFHVYLGGFIIILGCCILRYAKATT